MKWAVNGAAVALTLAFSGHASAAAPGLWLEVIRTADARACPDARSLTTTVEALFDTSLVRANAAVPWPKRATRARNRITEAEGVSQGRVRVSGRGRMQGRAAKRPPASRTPEARLAARGKAVELRARRAAPGYVGDPDCSDNACRHGASCIEQTNFVTCKCGSDPVPACGRVRFRSIGTLGDKNQMQGVALSDDGTTIVGEAQLGSDNGAIRRAFRWTLAEGAKELVTTTVGLARFGWSEAAGVSADGSVVAGSHTEAAGALPFIWERGAPASTIKR